MCILLIITKPSSNEARNECRLRICRKYHVLGSDERSMMESNIVVLLMKGK